MSSHSDSAERTFGISVGSVLCLAAAVFAWRGRVGRAETACLVGALLLAFAFVRPQVLAWPSAAWWQLARALGYVNTRIWLAVLFCLVLVPVSVIWRLTHRDPLARARSTWPGWLPYPARHRDKHHYSRMY